MNKANANTGNQIKEYNCKEGPITCSMGGKCLEKDLVYKAKVTRSENNITSTYYGSTHPKPGSITTSSLSTKGPRKTNLASPSTSGG